jgi:hypothetical protein
MKIVKVIWKDARTQTDVIGLKAVKETGLVEVHSIGYLLDENKDRIAVCSFFFPEEEGTDVGFRDVHFIPKSWIIKIITLKEK